MLGQTARFERFAAEMLYYIAAGMHIDTQMTERFVAQVAAVWKNPFTVEKKKPRSAEDIKQYVIERIDETIAKWGDEDGSAETGGKD